MMPPAARTALPGFMWDDVGIVRDRAGLERAPLSLAHLQEELIATGVSGANRIYNLTWHDWLNLDNLISVSRAITAAALIREDSCGAHYRSDFPASGDPNASAYTVVKRDQNSLRVTTEPVRFTRVKPGESLLSD